MNSLSLTPDSFLPLTNDEEKSKSIKYEEKQITISIKRHDLQYTVDISVGKKIFPQLLFSSEDYLRNNWGAVVAVVNSGYTN
jgi:hypothetical protein